MGVCTCSTGMLILEKEKKKRSFVPAWENHTDFWVPQGGISTEITTRHSLHAPILFSLPHHELRSTLGS